MYSSWPEETDDQEDPDYQQKPDDQEDPDDQVQQEDAPIFSHRLLRRQFRKASSAMSEALWWLTFENDLHSIVHQAYNILITLEHELDAPTEESLRTAMQSYLILFQLQGGALCNTEESAERVRESSRHLRDVVICVARALMVGPYQEEFLQLLVDASGGWVGHDSSEGENLKSSFLKANHVYFGNLPLECGSRRKNRCRGGRAEKAITWLEEQNVKLQEQLWYMNVACQMANAAAADMDRVAREIQNHISSKKRVSPKLIASNISTPGSFHAGSGSSSSCSPATYTSAQPAVFNGWSASSMANPTRQGFFAADSQSSSSSSSSSSSIMPRSSLWGVPSWPPHDAADCPPPPGLERIFEDQDETDPE